MPNVNGMKFPYTKEGKADAKKMAARSGALKQMKSKKPKSKMTNNY